MLVRRSSVAGSSGMIAALAALDAGGRGGVQCARKSLSGRAESRVTSIVERNTSEVCHGSCKMQ
jgi:hypothetical protein